MRRREFLATTAALKATNMQGAVSSPPRRAYKSGVELSVIGFGGIVVCGMPQKDASRRVAEAINSVAAVGPSTRRPSKPSPRTAT